MRSEGTYVSNSKGNDYEKVAFVLDISKSVCEHMEVSNLKISQIMFCMRLIHWVIIIFRLGKQATLARLVIVTRS